MKNEIPKSKCKMCRKTIQGKCEEVVVTPLGRKKLLTKTVEVFCSEKCRKDFLYGKEKW